MKRNNSFVFFASYYDAIKNLPEEEQGLFYKTLVEYAIANKQPKNLTPSCKACFVIVKPFLDSSISKYRASVENGKKGGRPKKLTKTKPNENPTETQPKPNNNPDITQPKTQEKPTEKPSENLNRNSNRNSNRNNYRNIKENNKQKEKKNLESNNDDVVVEEIKANETNLDVLLNKINSLQQNNVEHKEMFDYLAKLFKRISQETEFVIKNNTYSSDEILKHFDNLFVGSDSQIVDRFANILMTISNATNVSNRFKYSVSVLYQQATKALDDVTCSVKGGFTFDNLKELYNEAKKEDDFIHQNYTPEQIASCISDLDTWEV